MNLTKICFKCHETKPLNEFHNDKSKKDGKTLYCKECSKEISKKYNQEHKKEKVIYGKKYYREVVRERDGYRPMNENKLCPSYLGIAIGERLCRHLFKDVEMMPYGNTGYDVVCNKGKKIDVKTSCITLQEGKHPRWLFEIRKNITADYFIIVAFDNRTDLNPLHLWMIPGKELNENSSKSISLSTIHKWDEWKMDINDAQICCAEIKKSEHTSKNKQT